MDEEEKKSSAPAAEEPSVTPTEENQVNPVTMMTSHPAFVPVQDNAELLLDVSDLQTVPRKSSFGESDVSLPSTTSTMTHPTNQSVAAWLESTTTPDGTSSLIDRSPSLPSTLIDSAGERDRRNSTVSTLCDQQSPSLISETCSSQQISYSSELQRSHSFPLSESVHLENEVPIERPTNVNAGAEEDEEDAPMQFFAVPESEESEVEKKVVRPTISVDEGPLFQSRSPKRSPNVSFDATVPEEVSRKASLPSRRRRRRESLNTPPVRTPPPLLRAKSHLASNTSPLHSQVLRKQFKATLSMPHGHWSSPSETNSRQFSRFSDEVFRSVSDAMPSSGSVLSSDPLASIISDIDGRSGIESSSLTENEPKMRVNPFMKKQRSLSHRASDSTASTESLSSDSDDDDSRSNFFLRKPRRVDPNADPKKSAIDKRRDVMNKLTWLVERKQTMLKRVAMKFRHTLQESALPARRSTTNPFVEFCSSFQSNNKLLRTENDVSTLTSLPINTNESPRGGGLMNSDVWSSVSSLHSSLNLPKRRGSHRRAASGNPPSTRLDNELERQISQPDEGFDSASPLARTLESILNEHLTMINTLLASAPANASFQNTLPPPAGRNEIYSRLVELSQKNPMHQRCSRIETKAFIDLISSFQMNRSHHYSSLLETTTNQSEHEEDQTFVTARLSVRFDVVSDGHLASDESSTTSSPSLTRLVSTEATKMLRDFRTLSPEFLADCQKTEEELTKLFQKADQQHILYCLKHVSSGHSPDALVRFHRQLDALYVWYNLYYELTICVRKLSCLFRCRTCDDWPHLRIRSIATARERRAKRAEIIDESSNSEDESDVDEAEEENTDEEDETDESDDHRPPEEESEDDDEDEAESDEPIDDDDMLPKSHWSEEPFDSLVELEGKLKSLLLALNSSLVQIRTTRENPNVTGEKSLQGGRNIMSLSFAENSSRTCTNARTK